MFQELRIEVNKGCNFACVHCYTEKREPRRLPLAPFLETIAEAGRRGATSLSLTGGEPLLVMARTLALVRAGAQAGMHVRLNTNGFLLDADRVAQLRDAGLSEVQISLNSADAHGFDPFVQRAGAFLGVVNGIREAVRGGLFVSLRVTLMYHTRGELLPLFEFAERNGVHKFKVRALVEVQGIHEDRPGDARESLRDAVERLVARAAGSSVQVFVADGGIGAEVEAGHNCARLHCKCGTDAVFVASDGRISPCPFLREEEEFVLGSLETSDLFSVYEHSPTLRRFIGARTSALAGNENVHGCRAAELTARAGVAAAPA